MARPGRPRKNEAVTEKIGQSASVGLSEIGSTPSIEPVSENDFEETAKLEAFMNQIVTIMVHNTKVTGEQQVPLPNVNGVNQPIIRGIPSKVKRKYVEVLARCRTTDIEQSTPDSANPHQIQVDFNSNLAFPFAVYDDPHPNGREWLDAILAEQ